MKSLTDFKSSKLNCPLCPSNIISNTSYAFFDTKNTGGFCFGCTSVSSIWRPITPQESSKAAGIVAGPWSIESATACARRLFFPLRLFSGKTSRAEGTGEEAVPLSQYGFTSAGGGDGGRTFVRGDGDGASASAGAGAGGGFEVAGGPTRGSSSGIYHFGAD